MIIDAHTHIDHANHIEHTPEQLIQSMDEAGIDYSIVISNHFTQSPLDHVLKITKPFNRFRVIGNVQYETFDNDQIEKLIQHLKSKEIIGIKFYPGYEDFYPTNEKFAPLLEYCEKNEHPIMIHTGVLMINCSGLLKQAHPLLIDEIAHKYPKLKIVIAHMGNPWIHDTVAVMWQNKNVYSDLSGFFAEFRPIHPREAQCFLDRMKEVKGLMGSFKRFLFGTDWPLYSQKEYIDVIRQIPMTDEEMDMVYCKNAISVFNLDDLKK